MRSETDLRRQAEFEALKCEQAGVVNTLEVLAAQIKNDAAIDRSVVGEVAERIKEFYKCKAMLMDLSRKFRKL